MIACNEILSRLTPVREKLKNPTWKELIYAAYEENIDLSAKCMYVIFIDKLHEQ